MIAKVMPRRYQEDDATKTVEVRATKIRCLEDEEEEPSDA